MTPTLTIKEAYVEAIRKLPQNEQLEIWDAIFDYGFTGETECTHSIFEIIKPSIKVRRVKQKEPDLSYKKWTGEEFRADIRANKGDYTDKMLWKFFNHWAEKDQNGKMKFQLKETWETGRRLATWKENETTFGTGAKEEDKPVIKTDGFKTTITNR